MSHRNCRSMLGVTLLEIMLVLAIAGMIIVMSVRYYQSASVSNQTNSIIQQIVGIIAAEESYAQGGSGYGGNTELSKILPDSAFIAPWGTPITVTAGSSGGFTIKLVNTPPAICPGLTSRFKNNSRISITDSTCTTINYT